MFLYFCLVIYTGCNRLCSGHEMQLHIKEIVNSIEDFGLEVSKPDKNEDTIEQEKTPAKAIPLPNPPY